MIVNIKEKISALILIRSLAGHESAVASNLRQYTKDVSMTNGGYVVDVYTVYGSAASVIALVKAPSLSDLKYFITEKIRKNEEVLSTNTCIDASKTG